MSHRRVVATPPRHLVESAYIKFAAARGMQPDLHLEAGAGAVIENTARPTEEQKLIVSLVAAVLGENNTKTLASMYPIKSNCPWPEVILAAYKNSNDDYGMAAHKLLQIIDTIRTTTKNKDAPGTKKKASKKKRIRSKKKTPKKEGNKRKTKTTRTTKKK